MSWLKEQNRLTHEFCRGELSHFLHITACAFAALAVIGLVLGLVRPDLCSWMIGQFVQQMEDMGIQQADGHLSALMLLGNNLRASIACILYGFVPFLFLPALSLGVNAGLLGLLAAFYLQNDISPVVLPRRNPAARDFRAARARDRAGSRCVAVQPRHGLRAP